MPSLFIIGNGFDLSFGLKTSYKDDFKPLVKNRLGKSAFKTLESLFYDNEQGDLWSDFEIIIGYVNPQAQFDINDGAYSALGPYSESANETGLLLNEDRDYDMQLFDQALAIENALPSYDQLFPKLNEATLVKLRDALDYGMRQMVERANKQLAQINPKGRFPKDSYFITFNYTDTLQHLYGIQDERILHVHGRYANGDELVWGNEERRVSSNHIAFDLDIENLVDRPHINKQTDGFEAFSGYQEQLLVIDDHDSQIKEYANTASNVLDDFCHSMIKQLDTRNVTSFLHTMPGDVANIYVLGHSLADVDMPYIKAIADTFPQAAWTISYHEETERSERSELISQLVPGKRTDVKTIEEILS